MMRSTYAGKKVLITGCFSGMGEATGRALVKDGAEVHAIDIRKPGYDVASFQQVDLRDPGAIDRAFEALPASFDAVFYCAGLPQTFPAPDVVKVNFSGMRHFVQAAIERMPTGGGVALISSTAGSGYLARLPTVLEFIHQPDFDAASAWYAARQNELGD